MKRVFQVAKELNIHHDDIIMVLKDEGITVTSQLSTIDEKAYNFILKKFLKETKSKQKQETHKKEQIANKTYKPHDSEAYSETSNQYFTSKEKLKNIQEFVNGFIPALKLNAGDDLIKIYKLLYFRWASQKYQNSQMTGFLPNFIEVVRGFTQIGFNSVRPLIFSRDFFTCMICGKIILDRNFLHIDHIIPKSKFPSSHPWNLQTLCIPCNKNKGTKILDMIPLFLKGAKYRTGQLFSKDLSGIKKILNNMYGTISFNEEKIFNEIIRTYDNWDDILKYLVDCHTTPTPPDG